MVVDPAVSKRKFQREVETAKAHAPFWRQGVWIVRALYPEVFVVLVTRKRIPVLAGVLCGVLFDFSDFDVRPPSVKIVNPFTEESLSYEASWRFPRGISVVDPNSGNTGIGAQDILQAFDTSKPFLCLPGVREYHECSAHTGDSWFLHRQKNILVHILTVLQRYGPDVVFYAPRLGVTELRP